MNEAVAYLVLACGTGRDNVQTRWSTQALRTYAGISWEQAKRAIANLIANGLIQPADGYTSQRPRYDLTPYDAASLNGNASTLEAIIVESAKIWLPNSIVMGAGHEASPLQRLRSAGNLLALRLFVEFYEAHNLRDYGGIRPELIRMRYQRKKIGEYGAHVIWGFLPETKSLSWEGLFAPHQHLEPRQADAPSPVWESVALLEQMGLLTFVPHIVENSSMSAESIHPYGTGGSDEDPLEREIAYAADSAAREMCIESALERAENSGYRHLCPVIVTLPDVQMVGIARLRYRPHTTRTAAWHAQLYVSGHKWLETYHGMGQNAEGRCSRRAALYGA
ncbi:hypothetical protein [Acidipila rosea]|nr:hypothetical protein [Acidipila rosea]